MSQSAGWVRPLVVEQAGVAIPWEELTPEARTRWHRDHHTNKTGFLGVAWKEREHRFVASIRAPGRANKVYCGCGRTAAEAARRYDAKARELFGDRAVTNFPDERDLGRRSA